MWKQISACGINKVPICSSTIERCLKGLFQVILISSPHSATSFLGTAHGDGGLLLQRAGRPTLHVPRPRPGGSGEAGEPRGPRLLQAAGPLPHRHGRGEERR